MRIEGFRFRPIAAAAVPLALGKQLTAGMTTIGRRVMENAVITAPRASGRLASSHYMLVGLDSRGNVIVQVGANAVDPKYPENGSYAASVHNGSRPHDIAARRVPNLVFRKDGRLVVTPLVHHPGTHPQPWLWIATTRVIRMVSVSSERLVSVDSAVSGTSLGEIVAA